MDVADRASTRALGIRRNVALDGLKVLLAVMVVGIHTRLFNDLNAGLSDWLVNYVFRVAVPVFFLTNGYYLAINLDRGRSIRGWAVKIVSLYVTWTLVYTYFIFEKGPVSAALIIALGYWHLWYLLATLGAGLVVYWTRSMAPWKLLAALAILYALGVALQYTAAYHLAPGKLDALLGRNWVYRNFLFFGLPFVGAGFIIARHRRVESISRSALLAIGLAGSLLMVGEFAANRALDMRSDLNMLVALPLVCCAIFLAAARAPARLTTADLAGVSSVIYFSHPLFVLLVPLMYPGLSSVALMASAIAGCLALYPALNALNSRWPVFI